MLVIPPPADVFIVSLRTFLSDWNAIMCNFGTNKHSSATVALRLIETHRVAIWTWKKIRHSEDKKRRPSQMGGGNSLTYWVGWRRSVLVKSDRRGRAPTPRTIVKCVYTVVVTSLHDSITSASLRKEPCTIFQTGFLSDASGRRTSRTTLTDVTRGNGARNVSRYELMTTYLPTTTRFLFAWALSIWASVTGRTLAFLFLRTACNAVTRSYARVVNEGGGIGSRPQVHSTNLIYFQYIIYWRFIPAPVVS